MAISTYMTYLLVKEGDSYKKLIDVKEVPDLGGEPEMLETTTLSDNQQTYITGIQSLDSLSFTANYTVEDFTKVNGFFDHTAHDFAVVFGAESDGVTPKGDRGCFTFRGELGVYVNGGGVNEVVNMTITVAPVTEIAFGPNAAGAFNFDATNHREVEATGITIAAS